MESKIFLLVFAIMVSNSDGRSLQKRAAFYIANETACVVDNTVYYNGDPIPTDDPCEACKCRPPGFACVLKDCEVKPGCRAVRRAGHCCPDYVCGCEHNGRMYRDGDEIRDSQNPCYTCHCQGSAIACAFVDCFFRVDCAPRYVNGECCPRYDHCTSTDPTANASFPTEPTLVAKISTTSIVTDKVEESIYYNEKTLITTLAPNEDAYARVSSVAPPSEVKISSESSDTFVPTITESTVTSVKRTEIPDVVTLVYSKDKLSGGESESNEAVRDTVFDSKAEHDDDITPETEDPSGTTEDKLVSRDTEQESPSVLQTESETQPRYPADSTTKLDEANGKQKVYDSLPPQRIKTKTSAGSTTGDVDEVKTDQVVSGAVENLKDPTPASQQSADEYNTASYDGATTLQAPIPLVYLHYNNADTKKSPSSAGNQVNQRDGVESSSKDSSANEISFTTQSPEEENLLSPKGALESDRKPKEKVDNDDEIAGTEDTNQTSKETENKGDAEKSETKQDRGLKTTSKKNDTDTQQVQQQKPDAGSSQQTQQQQPDAISTGQIPQQQQPDAISTGQIPQHQQPDALSTGQIPQQQQPEASSSQQIQQQQPDISSSQQIQQQQPDAASSQQIQQQQPDVTSSQQIQQQKPDVASSQQIQQQQPDAGSSQQTQQQQPDDGSSQQIQQDQQISKEKADENKQQEVFKQGRTGENKQSIKTVSKSQNDKETQKPEKQDDINISPEATVQEQQRPSAQVPESQEIANEQQRPSAQVTESQEIANEQQQQAVQQNAEQVIHKSDYTGNSGQNPEKEDRSVKTASSKPGEKEPQKIQHQYEITPPSAQTTLDQTTQFVAVSQEADETVGGTQQEIPRNEDASQEVDEQDDSRRDLEIKVVSSTVDSISSVTTIQELKQETVSTVSTEPTTLSANDQQVISSHDENPSENVDKVKQETDGTVSIAPTTLSENNEQVISIHDENPSESVGKVKPETDDTVSIAPVTSSEKDQQVISTPDQQVISTPDGVGKVKQGTVNRKGVIHEAKDEDISKIEEETSKQDRSVKTGNKIGAQETVQNDGIAPSSTEQVLQEQELSTPTSQNVKSQQESSGDRKIFTWEKISRKHQVNDQVSGYYSRQGKGIKTGSTGASDETRQNTQQQGEITLPPSGTTVNGYQSTFAAFQNTESQNTGNVGQVDTLIGKEITENTENYGNDDNVEQVDSKQDTNVNTNFQKHEPSQQLEDVTAVSTTTEIMILRDTQPSTVLSETIKSEEAVDAQSEEYTQDSSVKTANTSKPEAQEETQHNNFSPSEESQQLTSASSIKTRNKVHNSGPRNPVWKEIHHKSGGSDLISAIIHHESRQDRSIKTGISSVSDVATPDVEQQEGSTFSLQETTLPGDNLSTIASQTTTTSTYDAKQEDGGKKEIIYNSEKSRIKGGAAQEESEQNLSIETLIKGDTKTETPEPEKLDDIVLSTTESTTVTDQQLKSVQDYSKKDRSVKTGDKETKKPETLQTVQQQDEIRITSTESILNEQQELTTPGSQKVKLSEQTQEEQKITGSEEIKDKQEGRDNHSKRRRSVKTASSSSSDQETQNAELDATTLPSKQASLENNEETTPDIQDVKPQASAEESSEEGKIATVSKKGFHPKSEQYENKDEVAVDKSKQDIIAAKDESQTEVQEIVRQQEATTFSTSTSEGEEQTFDSESQTSDEKNEEDSKLPTWKKIRLSRKQRSTKTASKGPSETGPQEEQLDDITPDVPSDNDETSSLVFQNSKSNNNIKKQTQEIAAEKETVHEPEVPQKKGSFESNDQKQDRSVKTATKGTSKTGAQDIVRQGEVVVSTIKQDEIVASTVKQYEIVTSTKPPPSEKEHFSGLDSQTPKDKVSEELKFPTWEEINRRYERKSQKTSTVQGQNVKAGNNGLSSVETQISDHKTEVSSDSTLFDTTIAATVAPQETIYEAGEDEKVPRPEQRRKGTSNGVQSEKQSSVDQKTPKEDRSVKTASKSTGQEETQRAPEVDDIVTSPTQAIVSGEQIRTPGPQEIKSQGNDQEEQGFPSWEKIILSSEGSENPGSNVKQDRGIKTNSQKKNEQQKQEEKEQKPEETQVHVVKEQPQEEIQAQDAKEQQQEEIQAQDAKEQQQEEIQAQDAKEQQQEEIQAQDAKEQQQEEIQAQDAKEQQQEEIQAQDAKEQQQEEKEQQTQEETQVQDVKEQQQEEKEQQKQEETQVQNVKEQQQEEKEQQQQQEAEKEQKPEKEAQKEEKEQQQQQEAQKEEETQRQEVASKEEQEVVQKQEQQQQQQPQKEEDKEQKQGEKEQQEEDITLPPQETTRDYRDPSTTESQKTEIQGGLEEEKPRPTNDQEPIRELQKQETEGNIRPGGSRKGRDIKTSTKTEGQTDSQEAQRNDERKPEQFPSETGHQTPDQNTNSKESGQKDFPSWEKITGKSDEHFPRILEEDSKNSRSVKTGSSRVGAAGVQTPEQQQQQIATSQPQKITLTEQFASASQNEAQQQEEQKSEVVPSVETSLKEPFPSSPAPQTISNVQISSQQEQQTFSRKTISGVSNNGQQTYNQDVKKSDSVKHRSIKTGSSPAPDIQTSGQYDDAVQTAVTTLKEEQSPAQILQDVNAVSPAQNKDTDVYTPLQTSTDSNSAENVNQNENKSFAFTSSSPSDVNEDETDSNNRSQNIKGGSSSKTPTAQET